MPTSDVELLDGGYDSDHHLDGLAVLGRDMGIGGVGSLKLRSACTLVEPPDRLIRRQIRPAHHGYFAG